tara:strand:+ start:1035 stop:1304 length:270 start_codon:yes stop_codon:yes gene_type:complete
MKKIDDTNKINFIFFLNSFFFNTSRKPNKPITKKMELCINSWGTNKFVIYDRIVINKIPLKPSSPKESLIDKSLEDKYPKPIITKKIIR